MLNRLKLATVLFTGTVGVGVGLGATVASAGIPHAIPVGGAYVTPGTGNPDTQLVLNTNGFCPKGNTNFDVSVSGSGVNSDPIINGNSKLPPSGKIGYSPSLTETMSQFASFQTPAATLKGAYVFDFNCFASSTALSPDHIYAGTVTFKTSGSVTTDTFTNTKTALIGSPATSSPEGKEVTLTASMTPGIAAGQVQFWNGTTKLGTPVKVVLGKAVYKTSTLAVGTHKLLVTFGPLTTDKTNTWGPSLAVLDYTITS